MDLSKDWVTSYIDALIESGLSDKYTGHTYVEHDRLVTVRYYLQQLCAVTDSQLNNAWRIFRYKNPNSRQEYLSWRIWAIKNCPKVSIISKLPNLVNDEIIDEELKDLKYIDTEEYFDSDDDALSNISVETLSTCQYGENRFPKLYCVLVSMHGLIRGEDMQLGCDSDTGGQVKYVVELTKALACNPAVHRVDLLTRYIDDESVDKSYSVVEEPITINKGLYGGGYISRIKCGPSNKYLRKEELWMHIREFADNAVQFIKSKIETMYKEGEICELYVIHGHYADAGEAATLIGDTLGIDVVFTGHSLGRNKQEHLLRSGMMARVDIERKYNISRRIEAEERVLDNAAIIFSSTSQEITDQWGMYHGVNLELENVPGVRHFPKMVTITPGIDFTKINKDILQEEPRIWSDIFRFLSNPRKPVILAICRPDSKKNIIKLLETYGENKILQDIANLVLVLGNRNDIDTMSNENRRIMEQVLKTIDKYNLYGCVAYPKNHNQQDISSIYLLTYHTRGLFINIAVHEAFGLTLIEAAAHGIPLVATKYGGPVDIISTLQNGILVDPNNIQEINDSVVKLLTNSSLWDIYSNNGFQNVNAYSWKAHCNKYLQIIDEFKQVSVQSRSKMQLNSCLDDMFISMSKEIVGLNRRSNDIDTFIDNHYKMKNKMKNVYKSYDVFILDDSENFKWLSKYALQDRVKYGVVSVFSLEKSLEIIGTSMKPKFIICICGGEIWYLDEEEGKYLLDTQYVKYIDSYWDKKLTSRILATFLKSENLTKHIKVYTNISHHRILISITKPIESLKIFIGKLKTKFRRSGVRVNIVVHYYSDGIAVNIVPIKSSRSLAIRYLVQKHNIKLENITFIGNTHVHEDKIVFRSSDTCDIIEGVPGVRLYNTMRSHENGFSYYLDQYNNIQLEV
jgi:sucrose-phosphate synthase